VKQFCNLRRRPGYTNIRNILTYFFLLASLGSYAQNVWIYGTADPLYAGRVIELNLAADYITNITNPEDRDTIGADGTFSLSLQTKVTRPVQLRIGKVTGRLYTKPDYVYSITMPFAEGRAGTDTDVPVNLSVIGNDSSELNALIFDFQEMYNQVIGTDGDRYLSRQLMFRRADSLQKVCAARYSSVKDAYFLSFVEYAIASLNASVSRGQNYLLKRYIINKPLQYHHQEYMQFFTTLFRGYFSAVASRYKGRSVFNIINVQLDLKQLHLFLSQDAVLKNDSLRELVMLSNLWEAYFNPEFSQAGVVKLVTQLNHSTANEEHRRISNNMLTWFNKLLPGAQAPDFTARKRDGSKVTLAELKGRYVYLNFFSTRDVETLREMPKIASLQKKYGDKVSFLSICLDDSVSAYQAYLRSNPKINWNVWHNNNGGSQTAKEKYFVRGAEGYFLISNKGYLVQSPALAPSGGIEYKFDQLFRVRKRVTKTGIR
jgi:hypothetical protein